MAQPELGRAVEQLPTVECAKRCGGAAFFGCSGTDDLLAWKGMMVSLRWLSDLPLRFGRVTERGSYVPQIDGLRFLAILPVLLWHSIVRSTKLHPEIPVREAVAWIPHGHVGVDLFFFISGYIIAFPFLAGRPPKLVHFYLRRLFRLEPPYILAMAMAFLALSLSGYRPTDALSFRSDVPLWQSLLASLGYVHWLVFGSPSTLIPPAWSLEVEIQFYLLSPFLLYGYLRLPQRQVRMAILVALLTSMTILSCVLDTHYSRYGLHRWTLVGHAPMFLLGIVISDYALWKMPFRAVPALRFDVGLLAGIGLFLATGLFWIDERSDLLIGIPRDLAKPVATVLVYLGAARGQIGRKVLGQPLIALIGGMCYSIYLTHIFVMQLGHAVLSLIIIRFFGVPGPFIAALIWSAVLLPASVIGGFVFYMLIERPCMVPYWPLRLLERLRGRGAKLSDGKGTLP